MRRLRKEVACPRCGRVASVATEMSLEELEAEQGAFYHVCRGCREWNDVTQRFLELARQSGVETAGAS